MRSKHQASLMLITIALFALTLLQVQLIRSYEYDDYGFFDGGVGGLGGIRDYGDVGDYGVDADVGFLDDGIGTDDLYDEYDEYDDVAIEVDAEAAIEIPDKLQFPLSFELYDDDLVEFAHQYNILLNEYQLLPSVRDFRDYVRFHSDDARRDMYLDDSDRKVTEKENVRAFERYTIRPRVNTGVGKAKVCHQMLGRRTSFPLGISPIPYLGFAYPQGDVEAAKAAESFGVPMIVSSFSNVLLEDLRAVAPAAALWMEVYVFKNFSITESIVRRAERADYNAIVVTVDRPVFSSLYRDKAGTYVLPDDLLPINLFGIYVDDSSSASFSASASVGVGIGRRRKRSPDYGDDYYGDGDYDIGDYGDGDYYYDDVGVDAGVDIGLDAEVGVDAEIGLGVDGSFSESVSISGSGGLEIVPIELPLGKEIEDLFDFVVDQGQNWKHFKLIRRLTDLPLVARGILTGCDARLAVKFGANAIIVSNDNGRALDETPAALEALAEVAEAIVEDKDYDYVELYLEGGIRWGTDIFKALAIGADAVFINRPVTWGLINSGKSGLQMILHILRRELRRTFYQAGVSQVDDIVRTMVVSENYFKNRYEADYGRHGDLHDSGHHDGNHPDYYLLCPFDYSWNHLWRYISDKPSSSSSDSSSDFWDPVLGISVSGSISLEVSESSLSLLSLSKGPVSGHWFDSSSSWFESSSPSYMSSWSSKSSHDSVVGASDSFDWTVELPWTSSSSSSSSDWQFIDGILVSVSDSSFLEVEGVWVHIGSGSSSSISEISLSDIVDIGVGR